MTCCSRFLAPSAALVGALLALPLTTGCDAAAGATPTERHEPGERLAPADATEALILAYWNAWQEEDWYTFRSALADNVVLRGDIDLVGAEQVVAASQAGNPWTNVTLADTYFHGGGGTIIYTAIDRVTGAPQRVAELITVDGGKITEVSLVWSGGRLPVPSEDRPAHTHTFEPFFPDVPDGPALSLLWGALDQMESGFLLRVPVGFESPLHRHSFGYRGLVLAGTVRNGPDLDTAPDLGPGSYWSQKAGDDHVTACVSETPCRSLVIYSGPFDNIVAETE